MDMDNVDLTLAKPSLLKQCSVSMKTRARARRARHSTSLQAWHMWHFGHVDASQEKPEMRPQVSSQTANTAFWAGKRSRHNFQEVNLKRRTRCSRSPETWYMRHFGHVGTSSQKQETWLKTLQETANITFWAGERFQRFFEQVSE